MKLKEFIKNIEEFVKENPEALEFDVITSIDDEGNRYNEVTYSPIKGYFSGDGDFVGEQEGDEVDLDEEDFNAVCIN